VPKLYKSTGGFYVGPVPAVFGPPCSYIIIIIIYYDIGST